MRAVTVPIGGAFPAWRPSRWLVLSLMTAAFAIGGGVAYAYFTVTSAGATGGAQAASLSAPTSPGAVENSTSAITVSWAIPGSQLSGAQYKVQRVGDPGATTTVCTVSAPSASCQDTGLSPNTLYTYSVSAILPSTNWATPAASQPSATTPPASPTLSVSATSTGTAGTAIAAASISASLTGGAGPTGTITWTVFGPQPGAPSTCTTGGTTVGTATVSGNGSYNSNVSFTPSTVGTYWWYASYNGDSNNNAAASACPPAVSTVVAKASPTLSASAPSTGTAGTAIAAANITAALTGGAGPTGTITWTVFGPQPSAPTTCTSGGSTVGTATVSGNGSYNSNLSFTPSTVGTYWWYASYNGDSNNNAAASACPPAVSTVVAKASPTLSVTAPSTALVTISASSITGNLSGGAGPTGTMTFTVFGPQTSAPTTCTSGGTAVGTAVTVSGNTAYHPTAGYTPLLPGKYWWYASYGGDTNNNSVASPCGSLMAETVVTL